MPLLLAIVGSALLLAVFCWALILVPIVFVIGCVAFAMLLAAAWAMDAMLKLWRRMRRKSTRMRARI